ncbi:hypothetical protein Q8A67_015735 [Cirrhinus molitorella]|uniref:Uncharacterized protein n=1 Tax=Cirrhinus molitorella TaxID=172907 RepID=A0AA88PJ30_9TELE|nr:hypothetical protein Q8A67_015735 [Cirrhinus molitorella]
MLYQGHPRRASWAEVSDALGPTPRAQSASQPKPSPNKCQWVNGDTRTRERVVTTPERKVSKSKIVRDSIASRA